MNKNEMISFHPEQTVVLQPPSDLVDYVDMLKHVRRFVRPGYPDSILNDTTYDHVLRCVALVRQLKVRFAQHIGFDFEKLERIVWLHDLDEIGMSQDTTAVDKAKGVVGLEGTLPKAQEIFMRLSDSDKLLIEEFKLGDRIMRDSETSTEFPPRSHSGSVSRQN